jgi:hypothetical protein
VAFFVFSLLLKYDWHQFYAFDFSTMLIPFFIYALAVNNHVTSIFQIVN